MYTPYMVPDAVKWETTQICHLVAMPYPGRGHVNPMMNLCIMLASRKPDILVSIVVTEEWHSFIKSEAKPNNVQFATIPNVIPSELEKAKNFSGFVLAVRTKMEDPFEKLLDRLEPPVTAIIADSTLSWIIALGSRKNIPVASLWPMSATKLSLLYHFDILKEKGHFPIELSEIGDEVVDYIPGVSPSQIRDFPTICYGEDLKFLTGALKLVELISKAQYLILTTAYELEPEAVDALRSKYQIPVYPVGPSIPFFKLPNNPLPYNHSLAHDNVPQHLQWLNSQPNDTVLYISYGSYLSGIKCPNG
ncbi:UDP-glycosyltransferase [Quillaja saponaria]|uniref:UDP-glycosyltransferase n=1 Tax=Quillaja saponaria TaxID=32244 RepID=A0AAD7LM72_QUISA|nr:UDP-glycosyltransferase [Quillaja saponaria]